MQNLREIANKYLEKTLENPKRAGTPYTIIDPQGTRHPVTGTVGDISLVVDAATGEAMQGRTIIATCLIKRIPALPRRGWQAEVPNLAGEIQKFFIHEVQPDNTIGLYYFSLGHDFNKEAAA
ncbi:MAG: hypothetical protein FWH12_06440 [Treponema sp.]|nr:hypothetical protein [Treponema sp.]